MKNPSIGYYHPQVHMCHEKKTGLTFHYTGWLIGILIFIHHVAKAWQWCLDFYWVKFELPNLDLLYLLVWWLVKNAENLSICYKYLQNQLDGWTMWFQPTWKMLMQIGSFGTRIGETTSGKSFKNHTRIHRIQKKTLQNNQCATNYN